MKIGEFAKLCGTKISVLRHYDNMGLLCPIYVDTFTEYRYYDRAQAERFQMIKRLKSAGFSLTEIRLMLGDRDAEEMGEIFEQKKTELMRMLQELEELRGEIVTVGGSGRVDSCAENTCGGLGKGGSFMEQKRKSFVENVDFPFENDEEVIGKWEVLGIYDGKEQHTYLGGDRKEIFLLPGGAQYWAYKWTKGKLILLGGGNAFANDYRLERKGDELLMIVDLKSFDYEETKEITPVALRKLDSRRYTLEELARKDEIDMPFVNDSRLIGTWNAFDFIPAGLQNKENWNPGKKSDRPLFFKKVEFYEGGHVRTVYQDTRDKGAIREEIICEGDDRQVWTKGYLIRKNDFSACAAEIKTFGGKEYLIIEWKSGDYHFGGRDTDYYVFVRA